MENKKISIGPNNSQKEIDDFFVELSNPNVKLTEFCFSEDLHNNVKLPFGNFWPYSFELLRFTLESMMETLNAEKCKWTLTLIGTNNESYNLVVNCKLSDQFEINLNWFKVLIKMAKAIQPNIFKRIYWYFLVIMSKKHRESYKQTLYKKFWNTYPSTMISEENKKAINSFHEHTKSGK